MLALLSWLVVHPNHFQNNQGRRQAARKPMGLDQLVGGSAASAGYSLLRFHCNAEKFLNLIRLFQTSRS